MKTESIYCQHQETIVDGGFTVEGVYCGRVAVKGRDYCDQHPQTMKQQAAKRKQPKLTLQGDELVEILWLVSASDIDVALMLAKQAGITDQHTLDRISGRAEF